MLSKALFKKKSIEIIRRESYLAQLCREFIHCQMLRAERLTFQDT